MKTLVRLDNSLITKSIRLNANHCLIANGILDALPGNRQKNAVLVSEMIISINNKRYHTPQNIRLLINLFDKHALRLEEPIYFYLEDLRQYPEEKYNVDLFSEMEISENLFKYNNSGRDAYYREEKKILDAITDSANHITDYQFA